MRLYLSSPSPWNTEYRLNSLKGQTLYEANAPFTIGVRPITITRHTPPADSVLAPRFSTALDEGTSESESKSEFLDDKEDAQSCINADTETLTLNEDHEDLNSDRARLIQTPGKMEPLAVVDWSVLSPSRIRYLGQDWCVNEFFTKEGFCWYGRNRVFTGPDGKEYMWKLGIRTPTLYLKETNTIIADYHRREFGYLFSSTERSSLEIMPEGEHMIDLIIVTFIYIEKMRKERERRARN